MSKTPTLARATALGSALALLAVYVWWSHHSAQALPSKEGASSAMPLSLVPGTDLLKAVLHSDAPTAALNPPLDRQVPGAFPTGATLNKIIVESRDSLFVQLSGPFEMRPLPGNRAAGMVTTAGDEVFHLKSFIAAASGDFLDQGFNTAPRPPFRIVADQGEGVGLSGRLLTPEMLRAAMEKERMMQRVFMSTSKSGIVFKPTSLIPYFLKPIPLLEPLSARLSSP